MKKSFYLLYVLIGLAIFPASAAYQRLRSFGDAAHSARTPMSGLVDGGDGFFYGVSQYGITPNAGTVFRVRAEGSGYAVIYSFTPLFPSPSAGNAEWYSRLAVTNGMLFGTRSGSAYGSSASVAYSVTTNGTYALLHTFGGGANDGLSPGGGMIFDASGILYGVASLGGANGAGVLYKMQTNGAGYALVKTFGSPAATSATNSRQPVGDLVLDANNYLYGVTAAGGSGTNGGTIYKIKTDGSAFTLLHSFQVTTIDGYNPNTGLALAGGGTLYGVTMNGGADDTGTIFKINTDGSGYARLHDFAYDNVDLYSPDQKLLVGGDGNIYGASANGGVDFYGGVFKIAPDGSGYTVIATGGLDAADNFIQPVGGLTWLNAGALLGEQSGGIPGYGAIFRVQPDGAGFTNVVNFNLAGGDATQPQSTVTPGPDGFLYGTSYTGGTYRGGTFYKIFKDGTGFVRLHEFAMSAARDGYQPVAAPVFYSDGFLYGTTSAGGTNGGGLVYKILPDGTGYTHIHDFAGGTNDGSTPLAEVAIAPDGTIFGTTSTGGTNNSGVIFKMNRDGTGFTLLHHFGAANDGAYPSCALTLGENVLYGTTAGGGAGAGTVFKLQTDGSNYAILYSFDPYMFDYDGGEPAGRVVFGADGMLYGTTTGGGYSPYLDAQFAGTGLYYGAGTVFKIGTNGANYATIYNFESALGDPAYPQAGLAPGADGCLYGTAQYGGAQLYGEVYKITTNGDLTTVCSFRNSSLGTADAAVPYAGVAFASDGTLYGTTLNGGDVNLGAIYAVDPRVNFTGEYHYVPAGDRRRDFVNLDFQGIAGQTVTLQRSTNLLTWTNLVTVNLPNLANGFSSFLDTNAPSSKAFYRASTP